MVIWLDPDVVQCMDSWLHTDNCKNRSEMIGKAIRFYMGYLATADVSEYETAHTNLHSRLNSEERKLLLRLLDMENKLRDEASLHSFISGFRLACGIHQELAQERTYSFENDEERRAEEIFIREQEAKACQENAQTARAASESERTDAGKAGTR